MNNTKAVADKVCAGEPQRKKIDTKSTRGPDVLITEYGSWA